MFWLIGSCRDSANEGLPNPVNAGDTLAFAPNLAAGFVNPAEHHGDSQRTYVLIESIKREGIIIIECVSNMYVAG